MFSAYILETRCAIIIQMFYRYYRSYRESAVFRIQRLWLRARISGTTGFTKHYRKVKQRLYQTTKVTQCQLKSGCVLKIQRALRPYLAKRNIMYIRAATILQSQTRRFLKRVKWTRLRTARSKSISDSVVKMLLEMVFNEILAKILKRRVVSAKIIQSFFRTYLAKQKFVKLVKKKRLKENAATIISSSALSWNALVAA